MSFGLKQLASCDRSSVNPYALKKSLYGSVCFPLVHLSVFRWFFNHSVCFFSFFSISFARVPSPSLSPDSLSTPIFSLTALNAFFMKNLFMFLLFKFTFFVYLCYLCYNTLSQPCRAPFGVRLTGFCWEPRERLSIRPHFSFTMRFA